jgi:hypothetical protein
MTRDSGQLRPPWAAVGQEEAEVPGDCFTLLLAGGGFKAGHIHGATDELRYKAVEKRVSCTSLLATLLNQFGLDHERLADRHHGRKETLTDSPVTGATVIQELLAKPAKG